MNKELGKGLDQAIDSVGARVENICEFLQDLDPDKPIDPAALQSAVHDCANVSQSMQSLKRLSERSALRARLATDK